MNEARNHRQRSGHLTPLDLDALTLGLLSPVERHQLEQHTDGCPGCQERRARHDADVRQFSEQLWARSLPAIRRRVVVARPWFRRALLWLSPPVLALAAVAIWFRPWAGSEQDDGAWRPRGPGVNL
jgi:anti-sigma factor RsiW